MPRPKIAQQSTHPYFISSRRTNKEMFPIPIDQVWEIFSQQLYFLKHAFEFRIHAAVLMSNHYHAIFTTPHANLSTGMAFFQREFSKAIARESGRINQMFGRPFHPCLLPNFHSYLNAYKYLYRNPVAARMVNRVEDYPYSTIHGMLGFSQLVIPIEEDTLMFNPNFDEENLAWLNRGKLNDYFEVKAALAKSEFKYQKNNDTSQLARNEDFVF